MKTLIAFSLICLPLKWLTVTSPYGYRVHPLTGKTEFHAGVDLRAQYDTVFAVLNGRVTSTHFDPLLGNTLCLQNGNISCNYGHLSQYLVNPGDTVAAGDALAITGASGKVTGAHLHFSIRLGKRYINPLNFLYEILKTTDHEQKF